MKVAVVGIGGYGQIYIDAFLNNVDNKVATLVAGIDPMPHLSPRLPALQAHGVPVFPSLNAMFCRLAPPDLVVIASPLHRHTEQAILAMESGSHVLCEKPLAPTPDEVALLIASRDSTNRQLAVGFQWSFAPVVRRLKADVIAGRYGRPTSFRTKVYWPRPKSYYSRNSWAGRVTSDDGRPVFDSPVTNACAHFIHNMLYLAGETRDAAAWPTSVTAELYRANDIQNFDTAVLKGRTASGVRFLATVSHATEQTVEPTFEYVFEHGRVISTLSTGGNIVGIHDDGTRIDYGRQPTGFDVDKLWSTIDSIQRGQTPACTAESAAAHTALAYVVQQSSLVTTFAPDFVSTAEDGTRLFVPGLAAVLDRCYAEGRLPSELGVTWAYSGHTLRVDDFDDVSSVAEAVTA